MFKSTKDNRLYGIGVDKSESQKATREEVGKIIDEIDRSKQAAQCEGDHCKLLKQD